MRYSWMGLCSAFKHEAAFRQELAAFIVLVPVAIWIGDNTIQYALLIGSMLLVIITELINSAIEAVVDRFGGEQHELSGRAKDIGSAAVLVSIIACIVVWILVFIR